MYENQKIPGSLPGQGYRKKLLPDLFSLPLHLLNTFGYEESALLFNFGQQ